MSARIAVLYEDKLAASKARNFGPHVLVLTCVAEQTKCDRERLGQNVHGIPRKGIGNLLADCRAPILGDRYARVIAVCDDDKVREHLNLPTTACKDQVRRAIGCGPSLHLVLLTRNIETVLEAAIKVLGRRPLTGKASPLERDGILLNLAYQEKADRRLEVLEQVPSLRYLVAKLARMSDELSLHGRDWT